MTSEKKEGVRRGRPPKADGKNGSKRGGDGGDDGGGETPLRRDGEEGVVVAPTIQPTPSIGATAGGVTRSDGHVAAPVTVQRHDTATTAAGNGGTAVVVDAGGGGAAGGTTGRSVDKAMQFPWKLHQMLSMVSRNGQDDIVSWLPCGTGFKVYKKTEFCRDVMPVHFNSSKVRKRCDS
jgi:hypothetical protein